MTRKEIVLEEIKHMPEKYIDEIFDFMQYLKSRKTAENNATAIASESTLKKDWLKPEEDMAWKHL